MTDKDKIAMLAAIDTARRAMNALETACEDHNAPPHDLKEVCDLRSALWRMSRRILELPS